MRCFCQSSLPVIDQSSSNHAVCGHLSDQQKAEMQDIETAKAEFERLMKSDDAASIYDLAVKYDAEDSLEPNLKKAAELYERAGALNHGKAFYKLGNLYSKGKLGDPDALKAKELYEQAIGLGFVDAAYNLALLYRKGRLGNVDPDSSKAKSYYLMAAEAGHASAAWNLASMYYDGAFGAPDMEQTKYYLEMAVKLEHAKAMNLLGALHETKKIKGASLDAAIDMYKRASALGNGNATYNLARVYKSRKVPGVTRQEIQKLFQLGADQGSSSARAFLTNPMIKAVIDNLEEVGTETVLKAEIEEALDTLEETFFQIRRKHLISGSERLAHFTTWPAIESILSLDEKATHRNCLRMYHVEYMNDPSEGQRLLSFRGNLGDPMEAQAFETSRQLKDLFDKHYFSSFLQHDSTKTLLPSVFTVSLTKEADRLDLWRAYGRDGAGYCFVFPIDQDSYTHVHIRNRNSLSGFLPDDTDSGSIKEKREDVPPLYWIRYGDTDVVKTLNMIAAPLDKVLLLKARTSANTWDQIASCVTAILLELLYLYKDEQYSTEKEARAMSVMRLDNSQIRPDERTPSRLYCETSPFMFTTLGSEVILGPKVLESTAALWNIRYRLTKRGFAGNTVVRKSSVPYR